MPASTPSGGSSPARTPFFDVTKRIHNGLQGADVDARPGGARHVRAGDRPHGRGVGGRVRLRRHPRPAAGGDARAACPMRGGKWIWRCHIDLTAANPDVWGFIRPQVEAYDAAIFTLPDYVQPDLELDVLAYVPPSIDPLSPKNMRHRPGAGGRRRVPDGRRPEPAAPAPGLALRPVEGPDRRHRRLPRGPARVPGRAAGAGGLDGDRRPRGLEAVPRGAALRGHGRQPDACSPTSTASVRSRSTPSSTRPTSCSRSRSARASG